MSGLEFADGDVFTAARMNQKTVFVGTGVQIAAIGTTYAGQLAFCTTTGSGFTAGHIYRRNEGNTAWEEVVIATEDTTVTGALTFDRDPSAPFAVTSGSAVVTNLDADKVDGKDASQFGVWAELGRAELSVAGDTITVSGFTAKEFLMVLIYVIPSGSTRLRLRFNNDSDSNYAYRLSLNGAADSTTVNASSILVFDNISVPSLIVLFIRNQSDQEKLVTAQDVRQNTAGAGNAPDRQELVGKWVNTSAQITRIDVVNDMTGDFAAGSLIVVLGSD